MRNSFIFFLLATFAIFQSCGEPATESTDDTTSTETPADFNWNPENFADKKIIRYQVPGFDQLTLQQKKLVYHLTEAGFAGRDIMYDQNYRHNVKIRNAIDAIVKHYEGGRKDPNWGNFMLYAKNVWFSNGIHHHYSSDKFIPEFPQKYFEAMMQDAGASLGKEALQAMFDSEMDAKKVNLDSTKDLVKASAVNYYAPDITEAEVEAFYEEMADSDDDEPVAYGLNSRVVRGEDGKLKEDVYSANGLYGAAIKEIIKHLEAAASVAENEAQGNALKLLVEYYQTGDLKKWDEYNIAWSQATEGDIDYINGFIEVYQDPKGYKGSYETIVQVTDFDASKRMSVVANNAQWFEDNSSTMKAHKKDTVVGISYKVVEVAGESGDASPSSPIGVNLPNSNWIRAKHGSKSVSLGSIIEAYSKADGPGMIQEFAHDAAEIERSKKYGQLASKMQTALHEVVGHASGKSEEGVGTPKETLKNYASPLEEARADLVALFFIPNAKLKELELIDSDDVYKAGYDSYIRNGMMLQLRRIVPGKIIEQAHMRNRAMVANWVYEKGKADNVIEKVVRDGKVYFDIKDYEKLHSLFGELLKEVQRIKSQGDYEAGRDLIENYGVQVDTDIHNEVLARSEKLNIPPYGGFINPRLVLVKDAAGEVTDIKVEYPDDFTKQHLEYASKYSFLK